MSVPNLILFGLGPDGGDEFIATLGFGVGVPVIGNISPVTGQGDITLVTSPGPGKFIRVHAWLATVNPSTKITWKSGSTALTGALPCGTDQIIQQDYAEDGLFDCLPNQSLVINLFDLTTLNYIVVASIHG